MATEVVNLLREMRMSAAQVRHSELYSPSDLKKQTCMSPCDIEKLSSYRWCFART